MTWNEQAETIARVWTDAQKKLWESWLDMTRNSFTPAMFFTGGWGFPGVMNLFEQWQSAISQGYTNLMEGAAPASQAVSRQLLIAQQTMMRLLEMTVRAWNLMLPKLEEGQDWSTVLASYMDDFRKQVIPNAAMMNQAATNMSQVWRSYAEYTRALAQPWLSAFRQAPGLFSTAITGNNSSDLIELTSLFWKAYDQTFGSIIGMPSVGFTRELEEKFARGIKAWNKTIQAMTNYQLLIAEAWAGVHEQVLREMMSRAEQGKPVESIRDLVRLWTTAADQRFDAVFRTEKYAQTQAAFVTAYMEYRIAEQNIVDELMKYSHIPTRTEMDEAHRNIYELRKEVKALKKALKNHGTESGNAPKKPAYLRRPASPPTAEKPETTNPASEK